VAGMIRIQRYWRPPTTGWEIGDLKNRPRQVRKSNARCWVSVPAIHQGLPDGFDLDMYFVLDDFGSIGRLGARHPSSEEGLGPTRTEARGSIARPPAQFLPGCAYPRLAKRGQ
jgi:hypothetical protein